MMAVLAETSSQQGKNTVLCLTVYVYDFIIIVFQKYFAAKLYT
jgi:hypothetical protein